MLWKDDHLRAWERKSMWRVLAAAVWVCALANPQPLYLERDSYKRSPPALTWQKRDQPESTELLIRSSRSSRQYDVPQIGKWEIYNYQWKETSFELKIKLSSRFQLQISYSQGVCFDIVQHSVLTMYINEAGTHISILYFSNSNLTCSIHAVQLTREMRL